MSVHGDYQHVKILIAFFKKVTYVLRINIVKYSYFQNKKKDLRMLSPVKKGILCA